MKTCLGCEIPISNIRSRGHSGYCPACELIAPQQAWTLLRVSKSTYHRLVRAGRIQQRHITAGRVLVERAQIDAMLTGEKRGA